jgi:phosphate:Na+ symporter
MQESAIPVWLSTGASFIGGLGLFLLGMWLMTDGLKLAAGRALERILGAWTRRAC